MPRCLLQVAAWARRWAQALPPEFERARPGRRWPARRCSGGAGPRRAEGGPGSARRIASTRRSIPLRSPSWRPPSRRSTPLGPITSRWEHAGLLRRAGTTTACCRATSVIKGQWRSQAGDRAALAAVAAGAGAGRAARCRRRHRAGSHCLALPGRTTRPRKCVRRLALAPVQREPRRAAGQLQGRHGDDHARGQSRAWPRADPPLAARWRPATVLLAAGEWRLDHGAGGRLPQSGP